MSYASFKQEWLGRRVDYDNIYSFQCVDLILQYVKEEYGLATGVWGNAIDYWTHPSSPLLTKFDKISSTDCKQGDIVVFYGLAGNPYGHIGIADSQDPSNVAVLEQNGAGGADGLGLNAIRTRTIPKSRIAGLLRPKAAPVPMPTPPAARTTIFLPASERTWSLYYVGSALRPRTSDVKAVLAPYLYPPGLTYKIVAWVGEYAVVVDTQMFGRGVLWCKGTSAQIK